MKQFLIRVSQSPAFWTVLNLVLSYFITELWEIPNEFIIAILPLLNFLTKYLNKNYNPFYKKIVQ